MSALFSDVGLMAYQKYLEQFEQWVATRQSSKQNASEALIEFTKINLVRTRRLHKTIQLNADLKNAAALVQHTYSLLLLTEPWCGDSAQNSPLIAELAAVNPDKLKLFILLRDENPELMNNYLTNGARAIPKLVVINETTGRKNLYGVHALHLHRNYYFNGKLMHKANRGMNLKKICIAGMQKIKHKHCRPSYCNL